jgi:hypothetical protein
MNNDTPRAGAARTNGRRSRGPTTEQGRAASALNPLRHGLRSSSVVLPFEDLREWEAHLEATRTALNPRDYIEELIVAQGAFFAWKFDRGVRAENGATAAQAAAAAYEEAAPLNQVMREIDAQARNGYRSGKRASTTDAPLREWAIVEDASKAELIHRYQTAAARGLSRALADLRKYRSATVELDRDDPPN